MRLSYVVPVHNEEEVLEETTTTLVERLREFPGSEVILVENGSTDASEEISKSLAEQPSGGTKVIATVSPKGFGNAYRAGIALTTGDLVVLTAADLPFAFTDLDAVLALEPLPRVAIGSKAHPGSATSVTASRRWMSEIYRVLRKVLIRLNVGDSQGTILIDGELVRSLLPQLEGHDYFVSTEILAFAVAAGETPVEVPIEYLTHKRTSKVRPLADGWSMTKQLVDLRKRLKAAR